MDLRPNWNQDVLIDLYRRYSRDLADVTAFDPLLPSLGRTYASEERRVLYLMTRFAAPDLIFEFSPKRGWSTLHMAAALERNGRGRMMSFELDPIYAAIARRALRRAGLAHRAEIVVGDVREELPRVYETLRRSASVRGIEFLFIDSDHGEEFARWYLETLLPLVRRGGIVHVHDIRAAPERLVGERAALTDPTGEEQALAQFLLARSTEYRWFSLAEAVRDPRYLAAVRPHGGGDLACPPDARWVFPSIERELEYQRNPSLWITKLTEAEGDRYPARRFTPIHRSIGAEVRYQVVSRIAFLYAPLRELKIQARRRAKHRR